MEPWRTSSPRMRCPCIGARLFLTRLVHFRRGHRGTEEIEVSCRQLNWTFSGSPWLCLTAVLLFLDLFLWLEKVAHLRTAASNCALILQRRQTTPETLLALGRHQNWPFHPTLLALCLPIIKLCFPSSFAVKGGHVHSLA